MTESRRPRSDSIQAAVEAAARQPAIQWPSEITPLSNSADHARALSIYSRILAARSRADWRLADLPLAAQLSNATVLADRLLAEIERDGFTIPSPRNPDQKLRNPALDGLSMMSSRQQSLQRMLGLSGTPVDRRTVAKNMPAQDRIRPAVAQPVGAEPDWISIAKERN